MSVDSPGERDAKAEVLAVERVAKADVLARELRVFRWEMRILWAMLFVLVVVLNR